MIEPRIISTRTGIRFIFPIRNLIKGILKGKQNTMSERLKIRICFSVGSYFTFINPFNKFYLMFDDNNLLCFAIVKLNKLKGLFTAIEQQGKGYATDLLSFIEEDLRLNGYQTIYCIPTKNFKEFYVRRGYKSTKNIYRKDLYVL